MRVSDLDKTILGFKGMQKSDIIVDLIKKDKTDFKYVHGLCSMLFVSDSDKHIQYSIEFSDNICTDLEFEEIQD